MAVRFEYAPERDGEPDPGEVVWTWVPYDERADFLLDADLGVSTHLEHIETAYSFRTRVLDYWWAGLPVVATDGDTFAPDRAGWAVESIDPDEGWHTSSSGIRYRFLGLTRAS